jgi:hypothetical protein
MLEAPSEPWPLPPLPTFDGGPFLMDISDPDALYEAMGEDEA